MCSYPSAGGLWHSKDVMTTGQAALWWTNYATSTLITWKADSPILFIYQQIISLEYQPADKCVGLYLVQINGCLCLTLHVYSLRMIITWHSALSSQYGHYWLQRNNMTADKTLTVKIS